MPSSARKKKRSAAGKKQPIPELPVGSGVWGVFLAGKKMSERSELFFPEEKHPTPHVPARTPNRQAAQARPSGRNRTNSRLFLKGHLNNRMQLLQLRT